MLYKELHKAVEEFLLKRLSRAGHEVYVEYRAGSKRNYVIFDVYDATTNTAYEILTAKFWRSAHEQPESFFAKIYRYLLYCDNIRFVIASFDPEGEIDFFHRMRIEHWHIHNHWWSFSGKVSGWRRHPGKSAKAVAIAVLKAMLKFAPLPEWTSEKRRARHPRPIPNEIIQLTEKLGLPKNFLKGLWRDWHLQWVWKLEKVLPKFARKYGLK